MRPLALLILLAACGPKTTSSETTQPAAAQKPVPETQPADPVEAAPEAAPEDPAPENLDVTRVSPPQGWAPAPMKKAPSLESQRGPTTLFALGGPYDDLAERTKTRAKQWLRRDYGTIDEEMVMAEHAIPSEGIAWVHYGLTEWSAGPYALAFQREDGWYGTPPIAESSKNYPVEVESIASGEIELGPDGLKATEITVVFETQNLRRPFTIKMVCVDQPALACTRPWTSEMRHGARKKRDQVVYTSTAEYPGDGTIVITADKPAEDSDAAGFQRPYAVTGTFSPFSPVP